MITENALSNASVTAVERSPYGCNEALFVTTPYGRAVAKSMESKAQREVAAYVIDSFLGWNLVPETILRECKLPGNEESEFYSFQQMIENSKTWYDFTQYAGYNGDGRRSEIIREDDLTHYIANQNDFILAFDFIINNHDRHLNNYLIDEFGKLWAIDNGDSMDKTSPWYEVKYHPETLRGSEFSDEILESVSKLLENKNSLHNQDDLSRALSKLLSQEQIDGIFHRMQLLVNELAW